MTGVIGVAISTTGDEHRLRFLETCVRHWKEILPLGSVLIVTVDGDEEAVARTATAVGDTVVYRVGQPRFGVEPYNGRQGVAANKNTGLELLMEGWVEHVFLCDDDTWPRSFASLEAHTKLMPHSMVAWGRHRKPVIVGQWAKWSWPRGSLLYVRPEVLATVGGMIEEFGPGGHEHVEWSRRIHQAGFTPEPYVSPAAYASHGGTGVHRLWHAEDMARPGEPLGNLRQRRRKLTSVRRRDGDWEQINRIMARQDGNTDYVPFRAADNGRSSATLYHNS